MQVMLIVRRTFCAEHAILRTVVRRKITKSDVVKRVQEENKALFGALIETRKEKKAREKREKKGIFVSKNNSSSTSTSTDKDESRLDPELLWVLKMKEKNLTHIKFKKPLFTCRTSRTIPKYTDNDNLSTNLDDSSSVGNSPSKVGFSDENSELCTRENNEKKELRLPPDILLKNMTTFPYLNDSKNIKTSDKAGEPQSISAYDDKSRLSIPSVTRILNKTMSEASKLNLELWKQRMILKLGVEGFEIYNQELLLNGKQFHAAVQNYLIRKQFDIPEAVEKSWQSVQHVLKDIDDVRVIESHVVHQKLLYRGIVDCVGYYKGDLCVIDWKKSDKPKLTVESTFDAPIQVASYIGAINADDNYQFQVRNGLVVVAYTNGDPATIHEVNHSLLNKYWKFWLRRLQQYYLDLKKCE